MLRRLLAFSCLLALLGRTAAAVAPVPNLVDNIDRPLRYHPEGTDFVIENGAEFFNRPLYGGNTAFRADGGDRPEFVLYLPGRGGNLRFGLRTPSATKWLHNAKNITTRYRPGSLIYEIRDPMLGDAVLVLTAIALPGREGLIVKAELGAGAAPVELLWAFGGVNGQRGRRDGDIGTEDVPIGEYFQLKPEFCRANTLAVSGESFTLRSKPVPLAGRAARLFLLMAGSTNWMQSRIDNGEVIVTYADGSTTRLALENPTTWWPIDQDYFIDDYQFQTPGPFPPRIDLKTGRVRLLDTATFKGKGGVIPGGAATVLELPLDPKKELRSLTVRTLSNEVVIGLMSATLARP